MRFQCRLLKTLFSINLYCTTSSFFAINQHLNVQDVRTNSGQPKRYEKNRKIVLRHQLSIVDLFFQFDEFFEEKNPSLNFGPVVRTTFSIVRNLFGYPEWLYQCLLFIQNFCVINALIFELIFKLLTFQQTKYYFRRKIHCVLFSYRTTYSDAYVAFFIQLLCHASLQPS